MRQSSIDKALACLPATKPQLAARLQVTMGRAQQVITALKKRKLVKASGHVVNAVGGLVQLFVAVDYVEEPISSLTEYEKIIVQKYSDLITKHIISGKVGRIENIENELRITNAGLKHCLNAAISAGDWGAVGLYAAMTHHRSTL